MKVLLSTPINSTTGYGNDGLALVRALLRWGVDLYLHPSSVFPPITPEVAALLCKPIPDHVDLLLSHRCPQELARPETAGLYATSSVSLAWTMWEWTSLDNVDTLGPNNCEHAFKVTQNLRNNLTAFDAVFAYDPVSRQALEPYHDNVHMLQGGVPPVGYVQRDWTANPFIFLMLGSLTKRKAPFSVIQAFRELRAAGELADAQLILKTSAPGLHPAMEQWCPGLKIYGAIWPSAQVQELLARAHVLLAPSEGEGKNIPAAQFAMSGGAVAATMFGGHTQWLRSDYGFPLDFTLKDVGSGAQGAAVDMDHLKQTMLMLYTNREEAARHGWMASRILPSMMNWDRVLERLFLMLEPTVGKRGAEVAALMSACRQPLPDSEEMAILQGRSALDEALA